MKFFSVEDFVEALKDGTATLYQIKQNYYVAKQRGYKERAKLFLNALEQYDQWKEENE